MVVFVGCCAGVLYSIEARAFPMEFGLDDADGGLV